MTTELCLGHPYYHRQDIEQLLAKRLKAFSEGYRQNVALIGKEHLGKSLLLKKFILEDKADSMIPVYVELQSEPFEYFAQRFMGALVYGFLRAKGKLLTGDFTELINRSKRYIPFTLKRMRLIKRLLFKDRLKESYSALLALPRTLTEETGLKVLLVLDEFDRLSDYGMPDPFKELGTELMMQKDTLFIVSSSRLHEAKFVIQSKLSLLFGNFEVVEIKPLSFDEAKGYIRLFLKETVIKDQVAKFLIQLTDGHPHYLHLILNRLKLLSDLKKRTISEDLLAEALSDCLFSRHGVLHRFFETQIEMLQQGKMSYLYLTALLGISLGKHRVRELSHYLERPQGETRKILNRLAEREVLVKNGSFHTLSDPLFVFWLKFVFDVQKKDLSIQSTQALEGFRKAVLEESAKFAEEDRKDHFKRIEELFKKFEKEDVIELSGKKIRCQDFSELSLRQAPSGKWHALTAASGSSRWFCQIAEGVISEEEVGEFIELLERNKKRVKNRVLVALSGIGLNAKLLAQESHIHIWDLKNLNFLLNLFGKSKIIPNG